MKSTTVTILISIYIGMILFAAGSAKAELGLQVARLENQRRIELKVTSVQINPNSDVVILTGPTPTPCLDTVSPSISISRDFKSLHIQVLSQNSVCKNPISVTSEYEIAIDLKAYFAEYHVPSAFTVAVHIENAPMERRHFEYDVLPQAFYQFDTYAKGVIEKDETSNSFYMQTNEGSVQVLSRFDLNRFVNKTVNVKALIPEQVTIGLGAEEIPKQLVIGQLVSLK